MNDGPNKCCADADKCHLAELRAVEDRNRALIDGEYIDFVHGNWVHCVQRPVNLARLCQNAVDREVVSVIVLRSQAKHGDAAAFKQRRKRISTEQRADGKILTLYPQRLCLGSKNEKKQKSHAAQEINSKCDASGTCEIFSKTTVRASAGDAATLASAGAAMGRAVGFNFLMDGNRF